MHARVYVDVVSQSHTLISHACVGKQTHISWRYVDLLGEEQGKVITRVLSVDANSWKKKNFRWNRLNGILGGKIFDPVNITIWLSLRRFILLDLTAKVADMWMWTHQKRLAYKKKRLRELTKYIV